MCVLVRAGVRQGAVCHPSWVVVACLSGVHPLSAVCTNGEWSQQGVIALPLDVYVRKR